MAATNYYLGPFSSLHDRSDLVSLKDARRNPKIVYRSLEHIGKVPLVVRAPASIPQPNFAITLIPLDIAASRSDIKYRQEGFEMKAARRRKLAVHADIDDELALRCFA